jgi:hypothetical protein
LDGVSLDTRSRSGVACFRSSVAIRRHLPRRPQVLVGMLRARRPQGHSKKRPHRNGWSGSQPIGNARDGVRPLGTTAHNDRRSTAVRPHRQPHPQRTTEGPGTQHRRSYARFPRHERSQPGHWPSTRSGPSPARSWPMSRTSRTRSASAERAQTSSASSRSTPERQARLSVPLDRRSSEPSAGA